LVPSFTYRAFISYSHAADGRLGPALQSALGRFAKPWNQLRAMRVFIDKASLTANPHLWSTIQEALDTSEYFILLASPASAKSIWVQREVAHWIARGRVEQLLIVLTEGQLVWDEHARDFDWSQTDALPEALKGTCQEEPLSIVTDLRAPRIPSSIAG